jgi:hypothetical protein
MTELQFAFGKHGILLLLPAGPHDEILESRTASALKDVPTALAFALDHPIEGASLSALAEGKKTAM